MAPQVSRVISVAYLGSPEKSVVVPYYGQMESNFRDSGKWRAGWDSNPRFAAPQAAVLVLARLPALEETFLIPLITGTTWRPKLPPVILLFPDRQQFHM